MDISRDQLKLVKMVSFMLGFLFIVIQKGVEIFQTVQNVLFDDHFL